MTNRRLMAVLVLLAALAVVSAAPAYEVTRSAILKRVTITLTPAEAEAMARMWLLSQGEDVRGKITVRVLDPYRDFAEGLEITAQEER